MNKKYLQFFSSVVSFELSGCYCNAAELCVSLLMLRGSTKWRGMVMSVSNKITDCSYQYTIQPDLVTSYFQFLGAFENTVRRKRFWSDEIIEEVKDLVPSEEFRLQQKGIDDLVSRLHKVDEVDGNYVEI
jgi:hypothetical protein